LCSDAAPTWNYVAVVANRTSGAGDPDLYAFFNDTNSPDFEAPSGFDFQDTSAGLQPLVRKTVAKASFGGAELVHKGG
jgi:hypothetical protein